MEQIKIDSHPLNGFYLLIALITNMLQMVFKGYSKAAEEI